ncbi:hypothetical protein [Pontivivens ytuae]|uniref:Uncharacterized protein n=1 Tax=Pontivivens ytuae TaxID=2789856 RepID=A0A7S9QBP9_9RHOB|nr:hypothetical protein [Pontivivens ytuae]QPH52970.1 hypothetical protein I0K15_14295 [Pontivivens ytuae]
MHPPFFIFDRKVDRDPDSRSSRRDNRHVLPVQPCITPGEFNPLAHTLPRVCSEEHDGQNDPRFVPLAPRRRVNLWKKLRWFLRKGWRESA